MSRILMITTSHSELGDTGRKTGLWLEEFTTPFYVFLDAGHEVVVASPKGGEVPLDPASVTPANQSESVRRFFDDKIRASTLYNTLPLTKIRASEFDALFYPGGHGVMWDLSTNRENAMILLSFFDAQKAIGAVCHGPAALTLARDIEGASILNGIRVTGFANTEEESAGLTSVVPFLLQERLSALGAKYSKGPDFMPYTVTDSPLVTGQNPQSSAETARQLLVVMRQLDQFEHDMTHHQMRVSSEHPQA